MEIGSVLRPNAHQLALQPEASYSPPTRAALGEDGLEVAFEEGAGVLEVLFGVGFGLGDALKRFVENADDPLLFGERGYGISRTLPSQYLDSGLCYQRRAGRTGQTRDQN